MMDDPEALDHDSQHLTSSPHSVHPVVGAPHGRSLYTASVLNAGMSDDALRIFALGRFEVLLPSSADQSRRLCLTGKVRLLLTCLLSAPGCSLAREQLMETLWPEQNMRQAQDSLRHSLSQLRRILVPDQHVSKQSSYLSSDRSGVWLQLEGVSGGAPRIWVDYDRFEALASAALRVLGRGCTACDGQMVASARSAADEALALYRDPFLPTDRQIEWAYLRRLHFQAVWATLMHARAELALFEKDLNLAGLLCSQLLQVDPEDEDATGRLMCIDAAQGRRSEALRIYERLSARLMTNGGTKPTQELQELESAIRTSESLRELRLLLVRQFLPT